MIRTPNHPQAALYVQRAKPVRSPLPRRQPGPPSPITYLGRCVVAPPQGLVEQHPGLSHAPANAPAVPATRGLRTNVHSRIFVASATA